jgi:hypothetical protein
MTLPDKEWLSIEDVILHVMKAEKCSRRTARKKVAKAIKDGKLSVKKVLTEAPPPIPLSPQEAAKRFDEDPSSLHTTLSEFMVRYDFSPHELLGELRSGRLKAGGNETTLIKMQIGDPVSPSEFAVDFQSILDWMANPKTPEYLLAKFNDGIKRKPQ